MSDDKSENAKPENTKSESVNSENVSISANTQETSNQGNSQQDKTTENKQAHFSESALKNAGNQGISLKPVGSHATNPFVSQDTSQAQPLVQSATPPPNPADTSNPPPQPAVSNSNDSE